MLCEGDGETWRGPAQHGQRSRDDAVRGGDEGADAQVAGDPVPQRGDLRLGAGESQADRRLRVERGEPGRGLQFAAAATVAGLTPILFLTRDGRRHGELGEYRGNLLLNKIMDVETHRLTTTAAPTGTPRRTSSGSATP